MCHFCRDIPKCTDFCLRLFREQSSCIKRGNRGTRNRTRLDFLTKEEVKAEHVSTKKELRDASRKLWWADRRIAALSVRVRSMKEASMESLQRKDIRRFCNNVIEAHRLGKFGGKSALWDFLQDIAQNLVRTRQGKRFKETSKAIFEIVKMWGGPRLHEFLGQNLSGPSMSTTKRQGRKAVKFLPGEHDYIFQNVAKIYGKEKTKHGITSRVPFIIVEDETVIKRRIRYVSHGYYME